MIVADQGWFGRRSTTVSADQALITDTVVTGGKKDEAKFLAVVTETPMEVVETKQKQSVGGGGTKAK